jgi:hypothetical protein
MVDNAKYSKEDHVSNAPKRLWLLTAIVLASSVGLSATDLTGTWKMEVELDAGSGSPTLVLKQQGEKVSGAYEGFFGKAEVTGTVEDNEFELTFSVDRGTVRYEGKLIAGAAIEGTCDYAGQASGTFRGDKQ